MKVEKMYFEFLVQGKKRRKEVRTKTCVHKRDNIFLRGLPLASNYRARMRYLLAFLSHFSVRLAAIITLAAMSLQNDK